MKSIGLSIARRLGLPEAWLFPATLLLNFAAEVAIAFMVAFSLSEIYSTQTPQLGDLLLYFVIPYLSNGVLQFALGDELRLWAQILLTSILQIAGLRVAGQLAVATALRILGRELVHKALLVTAAWLIHFM